MNTITYVKPISLASRLKVARVGAGLDQRELAKMVGVSRGSISNWERGEAQPSLGNAVAVAQATGVTLEWLAEGVGVNEKTPTANSGEGLDPCAPPDLNREPIDYGFGAIPDTAAELIEAWAEAVR